MAELSYMVDFDGWRVPLGQARARTQNLRPALEEVGKIGVGITRRNIEDGGGVNSWPDLSPATLLQRARYPQGPRTGGGRQVFKQRASMGPATAREARIGRNITKAARKIVENAKPLIWTRQLLRTLTYSVGSDYVDFGSPLVKSWTLFQGSRPGKRPVVPARNPFGMTRVDEFAIMGAFVRHIFGGIARGLFS